MNHDLVDIDGLTWKCSTCGQIYWWNVVNQLGKDCPGNDYWD